MTDVSIPDASSLDFNDEDIARGAKRDQIPFGWHRFIVTSAERKIGATEKTMGNLTINMQVCALQDQDDPNSKVRPPMYQNLTIPIANPEVPGHTTKTWMTGMAMQFLASVFDEEVFTFPRKIDGVLTYKGEEIDKEDEEECRKDAVKRMLNKCKELWADPTLLLDCVFYGEVIQNGDYVNIKGIRAELGTDKDGNPIELVDLSGGSVIKEAPKMINTKKATKKTAKKPVKKTSKKRK